MTKAAGSAWVAESLHWVTASRDDAAVAAALIAGADLDGLYGLGHAQIVDLLFCWLGEVGVLDLLAELEGVGVERRMVPFETFVILYLLRCLARVPSQNALPDLLFSDEALMRRLGFNAHQIRLGLSQRGAERREGPRRNLPLDPETLTRNILKLDPAALHAAVTTVLIRLWAQLPESSPPHCWSSLMAPSSR